MVSASSSQIATGFERVTSRQPDRPELDILTATFQEEAARFTADPDAVGSLLSVGISPRDTSLDPVTHAAMTSVARLLLNLDETIHKN